jgi:hypothetical protein
MTKPKLCEGCYYSESFCSKDKIEKCEDDYFALIYCDHEESNDHSDADMGL